MTKIMLDAGHGGKDPGAVGNGIQEKDITLALALVTGQYLEQYFHCSVAYTRKTDEYVSPSERARMANKAGADLFVSFHINSAGNKNARGFETFRYTNASGKTTVLQMKVHEEVMKSMRQHNVADRGQKNGNFAVVRETAMPAILTETLFISNPDDAQLLKSRVFIENTAIAHAIGIAAAADLKVKGAPTSKAADNTLYRLLTGTFQGRAEAEKQAEMLRRTFGWTVYLKNEV